MILVFCNVFCDTFKTPFFIVFAGRAFICYTFTFILLII